MVVFNVRRGYQISVTDGVLQGYGSLIKPHRYLP